MEDVRVSVPGSREKKVRVPERGGAVRELAEDDSSRKRFLKMVGGAGAASAFAVLLAACGEEEEPAQTTGGDTATEGGGASEADLEILNYALTLEFLEAKFYADVLASDVKPPSQEIASLVQTFGENEQEHVDALTAAIEDMGGTPAKDPNGDFQKVIDAGAKEILVTAAMVENLGAGAYLDQAPKIQSPEVLAAALSIHTVEARHAAALNSAAGFEFTGGTLEGTIPDGAFAAPIDMATVMETIAPFLPSGGGN
jgi:hypothetical protein